MVTSPILGVKTEAMSLYNSKVTAQSDGMIALAISGKGSFLGYSNHIPIPSVLILNPTVRLTVYKYLDDVIVQTKICSLSRRERQLIQAVAATRATNQTLQKLISACQKPS